MASGPYSFIDIAVLPEVRGRFAAGDTLVVLSTGLDAVIWANGAGAALLGYPDVEAVMGASPGLAMATRRQIAAAPGFPRMPAERAVAVRLASHIVQFLVSAITLPDGAPAVLLALPARGAAAGDGGHIIDGLGQVDHFAALIDGQGQVKSASAGFHALDIPQESLAQLVGDVAREEDRLVKRLIPAAGRLLPAGIARLTDDPALHLFIAVDAPVETSAAERDAAYGAATAPDEAGETVADDRAIAPDLPPSVTSALSGAAPDGDGNPIEGEPSDADLPERIEEDHDALRESPATVPAEAASSPSETAFAAAAASLHKPDLAADPIRFSWRTDASGAFSAISDEFVQAVGAEAGALIGRSFRDVAAAFDLDPEGEITGLLERRDTWSGRSVLWPVAGTDLLAPVDLAALPAYNRERVFEGFRGFGVARMGDVIVDPQARGLRLVDHAAATPSGNGTAGTEAGAGEASLAPEAEDAVEDPFRGEKPVISFSERRREADAENVIRLHERRAQQTSENQLSPGERNAFEQIRARLSEDYPAEATDTIEPEDDAIASPPAQEPAGTDTGLPDEAATALPASDSAAASDDLQDMAEGTDAVPHQSEDAEIPETTQPASAAAPDADALLGDLDAEAEAAIEGRTQWHAPRNMDTAADKARDDTREQAPWPQPDERGDDNQPASTAHPEATAEGGQAATQEPGEDEPADTAQEAAAGGPEMLSPTSPVDSAGEDTGDQPSFIAHPEAATEGEQTAPGEPDEDEPAGTAQEAMAGEPDLLPPPSPIDGAGADQHASIAHPDAAVEGELAPTQEPGEDQPADTAQEAMAGEPDLLPPASPVDSAGAGIAGEEPETRPAAAPVRDVPPIAVAGFLPSAFSAEQKRIDVDPDLIAGLPLPLLVHAGDTLYFANREFLALTGFEGIEHLADAGGLDALFSEPGPETATGPDGRRLYLRRADGEELAVGAHLQSIRWRGSSALLLALRREDGAPEAAHVAEDSSATRPYSDADIEELERRIAEMRTIIDTATDGVVLIDNEGMIRNISRPAEALFGFDSADVEGKPFASLFATESQRATRDYLNGLTDNGVASVLNDGREVIGREVHGRFIPLFMTIGRLPGPGGFCAVVRDITQWKRAEEELTQARAQAERASSQKTEFLARVSHEIRTPLNAIIGFSELMIDEKFGPIASDRYRDYLRDINRSGNHVLDLVNDLLDISKIEAGELDMNYEAVSLNDTLSESVAMMQPQANRERVIIRSSLASRLPEVVADLRSIRQIALNLLSNAIRYTPAGGQVIVSTVYDQSGDVVLRVRDTGIGMTLSEIDQALKPFKQINALKRPRNGGTGLGLPLTKAMVEANRARFSISSTPGEGTMVEITFPSTRVLAD